MARRRLDQLPCGGGSPLAHGMSLAVRFGMQAQQGGDVGRVMVVLITDGRANVSLAKSNDDPEALGPDAPKPSQESLREEVLDMAKRMSASGLQLLVIDTENKFVSTGFAEEIAKAAQGESTGRAPPRRPRARRRRERCSSGVRVSLSGPSRAPLMVTPAGKYYYLPSASDAAIAAATSAAMAEAKS
jgi:magnesium chelatase subunit D